MPAPEIDATTRALAIEAAKVGVSLDGIAHMLRMSRTTFWRRRVDDPEFHADLMAALAEYEIVLTMRLDAALMNGNAAQARELRATLVQRFPERHSTDPRIRHSLKAAQEGYDEDLNDVERNTTVDPAPTMISRLVDRLLLEDEESEDTGTP